MPFLSNNKYLVSSQCVVAKVDADSEKALGKK